MSTEYGGHGVGPRDGELNEEVSIPSHSEPSGGGTEMPRELKRKYFFLKKSESTFTLAVASNKVLEGVRGVAHQSPSGQKPSCNHLHKLLWQSLSKGPWLGR